MTSNPTRQQFNRRSTIAALSAAGLGLALTTTRPALAQETDFATHPMVGTWLVRTPDGSLGVNYCRADGTWSHTGSPTTPPADGGITYLAAQNGLWEPDPENEMGIHFLSIQGMFDATGLYIGTWIIDGYPTVSEDGQVLSDDWSRSYITVRDANDELLNEIRDDGTTPHIAGVRLTPGNLVFPPLHASAATPEG